MPSRRKTITLRLDRKRCECGEISRDVCAGEAGLQTNPQARRLRANEILHDLKSPLARLNVALGLARQQTGLDAQEALDRIELEAEKLNQMLEQLLGLARIEATSEMPAGRDIDLQDVLNEVIADTNFEAVRVNRVVRLISSRPCTVHGVKEMLRSAIENVARNALAHTADGTAVEISLTPRQTGDAPFTIVSVRDHGQGVPSSLLTKIFRPFFRVEDSADRKTGGAGLGLAIAKRAVRLHGGSITAANHPQGGLVVEIRLPAKTITRTSVPMGLGSTAALNWPTAVD